jgi:hypothetical protein
MNPLEKLVAQADDTIRLLVARIVEATEDSDVVLSDMNRVLDHVNRWEIEMAKLRATAWAEIDALLSTTIDRRNGGIA